MIVLKGLPGSPYTRKMLGLLRYRRLPYRFLHARHGETLGLPQPKVDLIPVFYFQDEDGNLEAQVDSTYILRRLENEHADRSVIPDDPVLRFLDYLLEDYADEWLTKAMFHYRWHFDADAKMAADILPYWGDITAPDEVIARKSEQFAQRLRVPLLRHVDRTQRGDFRRRRRAGRLRRVVLDGLNAPVAEDWLRR